MIISPHAFAQIAREMLFGDKQDSQKREHREFRAAYGAGFETIADLWARLEPNKKISKRAEPKHLLWTFILSYLRKRLKDFENCEHLVEFRVL